LIKGGAEFGSNLRLVKENDGSDLLLSEEDRESTSLIGAAFS